MTGFNPGLAKLWKIFYISLILPFFSTNGHPSSISSEDMYDDIELFSTFLLLPTNVCLNRRKEKKNLGADGGNRNRRQEVGLSIMVEDFSR